MALEIPQLDSITRVDSKTRPSKDEMMRSCYIMKTKPHAVKGDAYVIVTDHTDDGYLKPLQRLAKHRGGVILPVEDLAALPKSRKAREELTTRLRKANPRFVAIAPRLESYREYMLLAMWEVLSTLDPDPQIDVFPGLLLAPDRQAFEALIDHSINYKSQDKATVRPFVMGQVVDASASGQKSLVKVGIMSNVFAEYGCKTPSLVVRTFQAKQPEGSRPAREQQWEVTAKAPRQFVTELPPQAKQALDEASLLIMFGHGVPGMTCSLDVNAFHNVKMANQVVLCGSCFSAAAPESDFPAMARGADGSPIANKKERFVMRAVKNGAVVAFGHMRENEGFPQLYPVLESWMNGLTVGEAYQRQLNAIIELRGFRAGEFLPKDKNAENAMATMRRNGLLYVIIGDPALTPMVKLATAK
jgi:hypothetical protein